MPASNMIWYFPKATQFFSIHKKKPCLDQAGLFKTNLVYQ